MLRVAWTVGDVSRKLREQRGWTVDDLAAHARVNKNTVSAFERGSTETKPGTFDRIAVALGTTRLEIEGSLSGLHGVTSPDPPSGYHSDSDSLDARKGREPPDEPEQTDPRVFPAQPGDPFDVRSAVLRDLREASERIANSIKFLSALGPDGADRSDARDHPVERSRHPKRR